MATTSLKRENEIIMQVSYRKFSSQIR